VKFQIKTKCEGKLSNSMDGRLKQGGEKKKKLGTSKSPGSPKEKGLIPNTGVDFPSKQEEETRDVVEGGNCVKKENAGEGGSINWTFDY